MTIKLGALYQKFDNILRPKDKNVKPIKNSIFEHKSNILLDIEILDKINKHISKNPFEYYIICELTNVNKWYSIEWAKLQEDLRIPVHYPPDYVHRKAWEWVQCIYGLEKLGVLNERSICLGVGVGYEPIIYYLSNRVMRVIATDLYDESSTWAVNEGNPEILYDVDKFAPFPYKKECLEIRRMDGRQLEFSENTFDFIWSCSSIEHFGGHEEATKTMREMDRVFKPGGILALATEFVIDQNIIPGFNAKHTNTPFGDFFNLEDIYKYLIASHKMKLVQNINFSMEEYYIKNHIKLPEEALSPHTIKYRKPHIVLSWEDVLFTSIFLFFRKEL